MYYCKVCLQIPHTLEDICISASNPILRRKMVPWDSWMTLEEKRGTFDGHVKLASDAEKANRRPCDALLNAHEGVSSGTIKSKEGIKVTYEPQLAAQSHELSTASSASSYRPSPSMVSSDSCRLSPSLEKADPENLEDPETFASLKATLASSILWLIGIRGVPSTITMFRSPN
ncbi:MAG: hypothetical protein J3Q66DRAFT_340288 [Benniella sp.]|nr:MAG: hypothetical protein J3Q66DRAFT_340288 [Benniella sp.]